jgi:hypothetical protein
MNNKKLIYSIIFLFIAVFTTSRLILSYDIKIDEDLENFEILDESQTDEYYKDLLNALIEVESNGNPRAVGDTHLKGGPSIGILQIRPVMVDDVNRILRLQGKPKRYTYSDRYDEEKSVEMFLIFVDYYHGGFDDYEAIARTWNGGPNGLQKKSTDKYWNKVNNHLEIAP